MTISLTDVLNASSNFTPAKRDTPWGAKGTPAAQAPIKLPEGSLLPSDPEIRRGIEEAAARHKINPALLLALGQQESSYNPNAVGPETKWGRAKGMFQYLDSTAKGRGIDAMDWKQAADAAARDLADQIAKDGVDWAVAHHHGGPNRRLHGPKTARYTQEVLAKAQAIAAELGIPLDVPAEQLPDFSNVDTKGPKKKFSLEEVLGAQGGSTSPDELDEPETLGDTARSAIRASAKDSPDGMNPALGAVVGPIKRTIERGWEGIQNALSRETTTVERTDSELRRMYDEERNNPTSQVSRGGIPFDTFATLNRTATVSKKSSAEEEAEWSERLRNRPQDAHLLPKRLSHLKAQPDTSNFAPADTFQGFAQRFIANAKNPVELMLQDSIPANVVTALFSLPELERKKFDQMRAVSQALEVQANPTAGEEERELAEGVLGDWKKRTDGSVKEAWGELWQAAKDDPGAVAAGFYNALAADPYMVAAPAGMGLKPVRAVQAVQGIRASTIAGRAGKVADAILDGSAVAASLNVVQGAAANLAETGEVNSAEVKLNAAMGALLGGGLAPLFMRSAQAKAKGIDAAKLEGTLDESLRDMAKAEVELEAQARKAFTPETPEEFRVVESALNKKASADRQNANNRIAELLGVKNEKDYNSWVEQRRKEVKAWFEDNPEYADYQRYVAEARIERAEQLAAAAAAKQRSMAESQWGASIEDAAAKQARLQDEFDAAVIARNQAEASGELDAAMKAAEAEDLAFEKARELDAEETFYAMMSEDASTIRQTEAKIRRRNDALGRHRRKRNELGEASPEQLARLGVVAGGAAAGYALFPEDEKLAGGVLGGLAGLVTPAGGSVLSRMRQAGAISPEGSLIGISSKRFKVANKLEDADIKARDDAWVDAARQGDQQAFKSLYEAYFNKVSRYAQRFLANRESAVGMTGEDIAQTAFADVFKKIATDPSFKPDNLPAYLMLTARGDAINALDASTTLKRGADVVNESQTRRFDDEGSELSSRSLMDSTEGSPDYNVGLESLKDNPELTAMRDESIDIIRQAVEALPREQQEVFTLANLEFYSIDDIAKMTGMSYDNAAKIIQRTEKLVRRSIEENRRKLGSEPEIRGPRGQRGSADPEFLTRTAAIAATATAAGTAGYFMYDGDPWKTAVLGGMGAALGVGATGKLRGTGNVIKGELGESNPLAVALRSIDYRLREMGPTLYGLAKKHGKDELQGIKHYNDRTAAFVTQFGDLPKNVKPVVIKALSTRKKEIIDKVLMQAGGEKLVKAFGDVRKVLDAVEDQLVDLGLIKKSEKDYFPFRVKDLDGLKKALGKEAASEIDAAVAKAEAASQKKLGRSLTEIEKDVVINKVLEPYLGKPIGVNMPGFAKARTIQVIDEKLQPFYHDPVSTLNSYGVQAIKYIERAKFFGRHLKKTKQEGKEVADIGASIGALVKDLKDKGELTDSQAVQLAGMLQDRFNGGESASNSLIQGTKNLTNAALLGHVASAAVQIGDLFLQAARQGPVASVKALRRQLMRDKLLSLDDFGMNEHIAHEFLSDGWTRKVADWSFKWGGFRAVDAVGKNFGLNAAVEKMFSLARTEKGIMKLSEKYGREFPEDFPKALAALKRQEINPSVELLAFAELTNTQPITAWELPQAYHRMPNGRVIYHLQTFSLRVMNDVYERSLKDMLTTDPRRIARGAKNLVGIAAILGIQGVASDKIKDVIAGRPVELGLEEIPLNALGALGLNIYDYQRVADKGPLQGAVEAKSPPVIRMSRDLLYEPERSVGVVRGDFPYIMPSRYVPVVGRFTYDRNKDFFEQRRRERRKKQGYKMEITVKPKEEKSSSSRGGRGSRGDRGGR